ncbi:hypothetical protein CEXT_785991 [Caerostris extrusa]|uniref:RNA-directed DNA polymerase n=1 Tax=Caerostris extrusa TaxID=172846 RepID=A0AAV4Q9J0_CAEEX|nr:hypothetical protein CEXT_785991 [Caerostris extrusa]
MNSGRLLRYATFLIAFDYEVLFKKGIENINGDCLGFVRIHQGRWNPTQRAASSHAKNPSDELHRAHIGIAKMKRLVRRYVYLKRIDKDIEHIPRTCEPYAEIKTNPAKAEIHPGKIKN